VKQDVKQRDKTRTWKQDAKQDVKTKQLTTKTWNKMWSTDVKNKDVNKKWKETRCEKQRCETKQTVNLAIKNPLWIVPSNSVKVKFLAKVFWSKFSSSFATKSFQTNWRFFFCKNNKTRNKMLEIYKIID
jgi:hypothetical protein